MLHLELCRKVNFPSSEKWCDRKVEKVLKYEDVKFLWDCTLQTDKVMEYSPPDMGILLQKIMRCEMVNISDLWYEVARVWECKTGKVIPIVIGELSTVSKDFEKYQKQLDCGGTG